MAGGHGASPVSLSWAEPDAAPSLLGGEVTRVHRTCMQIEFPPNLLKFGGLEGGNHSYLFTGNVINVINTENYFISGAACCQMGEK